MKPFKRMLAEFVGSKKAMGMLTAVIGIVLTEGTAHEATTKITGVVVAWLLSQGIADNGKSAAMIDRENS